jgi:hypothetical protein
MAAVFLKRCFYSNLLLLLFFVAETNAQEQVLDSMMHLVSNGTQPEWEEFYHRTPLAELTIQFQSQENLTEQTIELRQYDVKEKWQVILNGNKLGNLVSDMNDMKIYLVVPPKVLHAGMNTLRILPLTKVADDIEIGEVVLHQRTQMEVLHEASLELEVADKKNNSIPCKITITDAAGVLQTVAVAPQKGLAVRPGNIYSLNGKLFLGLPAGEYTIYAGRGFEYSVDSTRISIKAGEQIQKKLTISHEVPTEGWVGSDTHIHTYTYSGHGDASIEERAISIAGEGIELPIITDHNVKVEIQPLVKSVGVDRYYTPVNGMEFTTNLGHFNVFPVETGVPASAHQLKDWNTLGDSINPSGNKVVILNHARDIHNNFRPFDPKRHVGLAGIDLDGWKFPATAMEVINSGSLQTNMWQLLHDWFGMMNRGYFLTPVGSSDSHDVSRYLVGQARTYIKSNDGQPGRINLNETIKNFQAGKVSVSMGLLTQIIVNDKYEAGELAPSTNKVTVSVRVSGPGWTSVNRVSLYANGKKIREELIGPISSPGVKWKGSWILPKFKNDVFLVAVAEGPYTHLPFWPLVKPFQPRSPEWKPAVIGISGAVWMDTDGDGQKTSAFKYASDAWKKSNGNIQPFIKRLASFDEAVAVQAASILQQQGWSLKEPQLQKTLEKATTETKTGFQDLLREWEQSK